MNLILHHLRKDIRALRWVLALWLLVALAVALPDLLIFQPDYHAARAIDAYRDSAAAILIGLIAWTILLARLIQSEPVTGSASFWLTRPIPRRVSMPSQLLFIAILIMLPAFVPAISHAIIFQADAHMFAGQMTGWLVVQLAAAVCVIWLATYTANLIHFAGLLCLAAVLFFLAAIINAQMRRFSPNEASPEVFFTILCIGFLGSLVIAHVQRGGRVGFYIGVATFFIGIAYLCLGSTPEWKSIYAGPAVGKSVKVDIDSDWASTLRWSHTSYGNNEQVPAAFANLKPTEETPGSRIWVTNVSAEFEARGPFRGVLPGVGPSFFSAGRDESLNRDLVQALLPNISLPKEQYQAPRNYDTGLFNLSAIEPEVRNETGTLRLHVTGEVLELRQLAAIPLNDPRYIARIPGGFLRVAPVRPGGDGQLRLWAVAPRLFYYNSTGDYLCVLVNPQTSTGKILQSGGASSFTSSFGLSGTQTIVDSEITYQLNGNDPLENQLLYVFQYTPTADFSTELVAPGFKMSPPD
jgi:hypothetical protein